MAAHGDIACNIAMQLARRLRLKPRDIATAIVDALRSRPELPELITSIDIAGPGFINFHLTPRALRAVLDDVAAQDSHFGFQPRNGQKLLVEYVSANPTGPLHVGHARQGALGDAICRLFTSQGYAVTREFYYNDAGNQINNLAISVQARARGVAPESAEFPADGYKGDYIRDIADDFLAGATVRGADGEPVTASRNLDDLDAIRRFAVAYLRHEQDLDLQAFGLRFDNYFLESSLYGSGQVQTVVDALTRAGHTYESEGALWLRTTTLGTGDDKDRVMRKSDGSYTYFVPDVAYHLDKWTRGFHRAVNVQGSDHHGTVARVRAGLQGLDADIPKDYPAYVLHKMVKVLRNGVEVKISKRAGSYVTLRDLVDWVGRDAARYFLIMRRADSEFVFDVDLALSKSEDNPVYYVQYAHARICSVLAHAGVAHDEIVNADTAALTSAADCTLLRRLGSYPDMLTQAALELAPHHVAFWLRDCAAEFHAWYGAERVLVDDAELRLARLRLAHATSRVLAAGLQLLGVSAPEQM